MAITDFLLNKSSLQEQRDRAIDYAEEAYNPAIYNPQVNLARERAVEGISEGQESIARQRTVESLFRPTDTSIYGGNQARAIAGQQQRNRQAQAGLADFETELTRQDIQTQQQGQQQFAQARSRQLQTAAQRDAAIEEAEMQYEAELENRRKQLGSAVANLAGTVAGSFLGPAGAAAGGALAGGIFGGGSGAVQGAGAGFTTSFQRQQSQDFIDQLTGETTSEQPTAPQRPTVPSEAPQDQPILPDFSDVSGMDLNLPQPIQTQQAETTQQQGQQQQALDLDFINQLVSDVQQGEQTEQLTPQEQFEQFQQFERQRGLQALGLNEPTPLGDVPSSFGEAGSRFAEGAQQFGGELDWFRRNVLGFETQEERFNRLMNQ